MLRARSTTLFLLLSICGSLWADSPNELTIFTSGNQRTALIELFTSEGCSSCPPADRWLSGLKSDARLWKDYVPVAFHVDYWDYIGWKDRFSRAEFSDRQRRYADEGGTRVVYTPGFFRHGRDWRGWRSGEIGKAEKASAGNLTVRIDDGNATIHFDSLEHGQRRLTAHMALLGMDLETRVRAGENKGRKLRHDFVALDLTSVPLKRTGSAHKVTTPLPGAKPDAQDLALAVWISEAGTQAPIQSVGGYLPTSAM